MLHATSSDGVEVAVHDFGGDTSAPPLLISHATGFHAHCYEPVAARLIGRFRVFGLDYRGHGRTSAPSGWAVDWSRFGDDAVAAATAIAPDGGLVGVGHSMGGAALLMAAARRPELFTRLVLFEPIAIPPGGPEIEMDRHPIVVGARRRRRIFESEDDAVGNYRDKPPLSVMRDDVLRAYVRHGFRPVTGRDGTDGIELVCAADIESGIFVSARRNGVWELLPTVETPVLVVSGIVDDDQPSGRCEAIAERLPNAGYLRLDHQSHLGPFSHPDEFADLVLHRTRGV